jgi:hypothetical protein
MIWLTAPIGALRRRLHGGGAERRVALLPDTPAHNASWRQDRRSSKREALSGVVELTARIGAGASAGRRLRRVAAL